MTFADQLDQIVERATDDAIEFHMSVDRFVGDRHRGWALAESVRVEQGSGPAPPWM